ncbi:hypothetical protein [Paraconexibacter sp. AEG42_29]|uniref:hypothetical protein n=1 Tax=Paraconexibacter sp. AEG42_29 TaxID=2997339 RepID=UPI00339D8398
MRRALLIILVPLLLMTAGVGAPAAAAAARPVTTSANAEARMGKVGAPPRSARAAARLVFKRPELRPENRAATHRRPTKAQLARFRRQSDMPYRSRVSGQYAGTTDQVIQWAAFKHRIPVDLARAVAVVESYWVMSTLGDNGDSFGLFQMRRPYHCCLPFMQRDAAFNADYWGAIVRAFYDGRQTWLNTVDGNGRGYTSGDLWGSLGVWASGRWHDGSAETYIAKVKQVLDERTWTTENFRRYYTVAGRPVDRGPR